MNVTANERRSVLRLLNVAEAARKLEIPEQQMYREIRAGRLPTPTVQLARRLYYHAADVAKLAEQRAQRTSHS